MLVSTKKSLNQAGVTIVELMITISIASLVILAFTSISINLYGEALRTSIYSQLASESQTILRSMVEELRQSSSIRSNNANPDVNAPSGGWTTSNERLILIISTPALDNNNNFITNQSTGFPYQNEIVYFANNGMLYKRLLANPSATGNSMRTTCPQNLATSSCPSDIQLSNHFESLNFTFYDQNNTVTTSIPATRSIQLFISMERTSFGKTLEFDNNIRITIRNNAS